ncbi:hypothetical protein TNCV_1497131 [Trichonephila clavipes]|nr:hypothetical protein TNCV_1497131 [Trichonephila clavipes]
MCNPDVSGYQTELSGSLFDIVFDRILPVTDMDKSMYIALTRTSFCERLKFGICCVKEILKKNISDLTA